MALFDFGKAKHSVDADGFIEDLDVLKDVDKAKTGKHTWLEPGEDGKLKMWQLFAILLTLFVVLGFLSWPDGTRGWEQGSTAYAAGSAEGLVGSSKLDSPKSDDSSKEPSISEREEIQQRKAAAVEQAHNNKVEESKRKAAEEVEQDRKAAEEKAAAEAASKAQAEANARREAEDAAAKAQAANVVSQHPVQQPASNPTQAPAPAPAPSGPVNHLTSRYCWTDWNISDCQWAIDMGGLVHVESPAFDGDTSCARDACNELYLGHNSTESWILNLNVGDTVRIDGYDYKIASRSSYPQNGGYDYPHIALQTCEYGNGQVRLLTLEAL